MAQFNRMLFAEERKKTRLIELLENLPMKKTLVDFPHFLRYYRRSNSKFLGRKYKLKLTKVTQLV